MIRIEKSTRLTPTEIIDKATAYFGDEGEELEQKEICTVTGFWLASLPCVPLFPKRPQ